MPPGNFADHRSQHSLNAITLAQTLPKRSRRSKRRLIFITSPSSPGKAPRPFPLRCCAIGERVWLRETRISCDQDSLVIARLAGPPGYPLRTSAVLPCGALLALAPCTTRPLTTIAGGEDSFSTKTRLNVKP